MSFKVHFRHEAEKDITEAAEWYESQRKGLGSEFLDEILNACQLISENPELYPAVHRNSRRALIHKFPFGVFYKVIDKSIVVIAVMHGSRKPSKWKNRT